MNVEYIARITCACGTQCEVPAEIEHEERGRGYSSYREGVLSCSGPAGWLGGYDDHPYECPACVEKRYA